MMAVNRFVHKKFDRLPSILVQPISRVIHKIPILKPYIGGATFSWSDQCAGIYSTSPSFSHGSADRIDKKHRR